MSMFLGIQGTYNKSESKKEKIISNPMYLGIQKNKTSSINSKTNNDIKMEEGGNTTLYYLKTTNKRGQIRYKVGITKRDLKKRYGRKNSIKYEILMEKRIIRAKSVEKKIKREFKSSVTNEKLLGTKGTEIFSNDILDLDNRKKSKVKIIKYF